MPKQYNPNAIRRCVRKTAEIDGTYAFKTKSFTKAEGEWHPLVEITPDGEVHFECDCPDWTYRKRKVNEPCKHISRALVHLARKDVL